MPVHVLMLVCICRPYEWIPGLQERLEPEMPSHQYAPTIEHEGTRQLFAMASRQQQLQALLLAVIQPLTRPLASSRIHKVMKMSEISSHRDTTLLDQQWLASQGFGSESDQQLAAILKGIEDCEDSHIPHVVYLMNNEGSQLNSKIPKLNTFGVLKQHLLDKVSRHDIDVYLTIICSCDSLDADSYASSWADPYQPAGQTETVLSWQLQQRVSTAPQGVCLEALGQHQMLQPYVALTLRACRPPESTAAPMAVTQPATPAAYQPQSIPPARPPSGKKRPQEDKPSVPGEGPKPASEMPVAPRAGDPSTQSLSSKRQKHEV